jgi:Domain of unknown function (DUF4388)
MGPIRTIPPSRSIPPAPDHDLVQIEETGECRPVGTSAKEAMLALRTAAARMLPSPSHVVVLREHDETRPPQDLWITGEITSGGRMLDIMSMVASSKWSGELAVHDGVHERAVHVREGLVVGASSNAPHERLGPMLKNLGEMTDEQLQVASDAMGEDVRFGEAAVQLGFIGRETLFRYLHRQTEEIVYATMQVSRGTFSFREHEDVLSTFPLNLSLVDLVLEGVRRIDAMEAFRDGIPSGEHLPVRVEGKLVDASDEAYAVYLLVNGERSVDDIAHAAALSAFEVTKQLYRLLKKGAIAIRAPGSSGLEGVISVFNQALVIIHAEVDKYKASGQDIRFSLKSFAGSGVVYAPLFRGAGPAEDGSFDPQVLAENLADMELDDPLTSLSEWLYEYASFAMFIAEPVLRAGAKSNAAAVSSQVAALLQPLAPDFW